MALEILHHVPIVTTIVAAGFLVVLVRKYLRRPGPSMLWWIIGVVTYGLGTAIESAITLGGNTVLMNKAWYIAGALWGGYPLGQGTVYLVFKRRAADLLTAVSAAVVAVASVLVWLSPVDVSVLDPTKPSGAILEWQWLRLITPFVNLWAAWFLIGGALLSAIRFFRSTETLYRARGAGLIALGGLLPGIGGAMAKAGMVEGLYVGELLGLILIFAGTLTYSYRPELAGTTPQPVETEEPEPATSP